MAIPAELANCPTCNWAAKNDVFSARCLKQKRLRNLFQRIAVNDGRKLNSAVHTPHFPMRLVICYPVDKRHLSQIAAIAPHFELVEAGQENIAELIHSA